MTGINNKNTEVIVVESGGSKSNWRFFDTKHSKNHFETVGLHPLELNTKKTDTLKLLIDKSSINKNHTVYFYGAGCESNKGREIILNLFNSIGFKNVSVNTDLLGACIACWGNKPGITGILGTGAISAKYNGKTITEYHSGLGFILGDEGSGFDLGKKFLRSYFQKQLNDSMNEAIVKHFDGDDKIISKTYNDNGRKIVADLTKIMKKNENHPVVHQIIISSFHDFVKYALEPIGELKEIALVGSIAFHFRSQLETVLKSYNITVKEVLISADEKLFEYHL